MLKAIHTLVPVIGLIVSLTISARAQFDSASIIWFRVNDNVSAPVELSLGEHIGSTYGIDSTLPQPWKESEIPPDGVGGLNAYSAPIPGRSGQWDDVSGLWRDYRGYSSPTQKDTFVIRFVSEGFPSATISFKWPDAEYLAARCDSIIIVDRSNQMDPPRINMADRDTFDIPNAGDIPLIQFTIYKYGVNNGVVEEVKQLTSKVPQSFALRQNYPNPFNPTTTITFDVRKSAVTDISIFNVLGQKVSTLVSRELSPGTYSTIWNGKADNGMPVSSGVYYIRFNANAGTTGERFTSLRKLLLMK